MESMCICCKIFLKPTFKFLYEMIVFTSQIPSSIVKRTALDVPLPKSKTMTFLSPLNLLLNLWARPAAAGSLMIWSTFKSTIIPHLLHIEFESH